MKYQKHCACGQAISMHAIRCAECARKLHNARTNAHNKEKRAELFAERRCACGKVLGVREKVMCAACRNDYERPCAGCGRPMHGRHGAMCSPCLDRKNGNVIQRYCACGNPISLEGHNNRKKCDVCREKESALHLSRQSEYQRITYERRKVRSEAGLQGINIRGRVKFVSYDLKRCGDYETEADCRAIMGRYLIGSEFCASFLASGIPDGLIVVQGVRRWVVDNQVLVEVRA